MNLSSESGLRTRFLTCSAGLAFEGGDKGMPPPRGELHSLLVVGALSIMERVECVQSVGLLSRCRADGAPDICASRVCSRESSCVSSL